MRGTNALAYFVVTLVTQKAFSPGSLFFSFYVADTKKNLGTNGLAYFAVV